jgi:hypothetical protein
MEFLPELTPLAVMVLSFWVYESFTVTLAKKVNYLLLGSKLMFRFPVSVGAKRWKLGRVAF